METSIAEREFWNMERLYVRVRVAVNLPRFYLVSADMVEGEYIRTLNNRNRRSAEAVSSIGTCGKGWN